MQIKLEWEPESLRWLETMPTRMTAAVREGIERGTNLAMKRARIKAGLDIPRFEGWAAEDMHAAPGTWGGNGNLFEAFLSFISDRTMVSEVDTIKHPAPFSYPWAKHTPGAGSHRVWLFSARGPMTEQRKKLIRWLKLHGTGYDWSLLPEEPTKELWNKYHKEGFPPPYTEVTPSSSATPYFDDLIANGGDPLATWVIDGFWPPVKRAWEVAV